MEQWTHGGKTAKDSHPLVQFPLFLCSLWQQSLIIMTFHTQEADLILFSPPLSIAILFSIFSLASRITLAIYYPLQVTAGPSSVK